MKLDLTCLYERTAEAEMSQKQKNSFFFFFFFRKEQRNIGSVLFFGSFFSLKPN